MTIDWSANSKVFGSLTDAIGRTPIVKLDKITAAEHLNATIYAKLDYLNPSGSLKDRVYYAMITNAIREGTLKKGMKIVEVSTGNAGIACTMIGTLFGYEVLIVMPEGMSEERKKIINMLGGEILETPGAESDVDLSYEKAKELVTNNPGKYWFPDQYTNKYAILAHYETTAQEMWEQTGGNIDSLVLTQGTGTTLTGVGKYLKEVNPNVKIYATEPTEAPLLANRRWGSHKIEGIGDGFVPVNLDLKILTGIVTVTSEEAIEMAKKIIREEKLLVGISSGANVAASIKVSKLHKNIKTIATMMNDSALRYFSTALFDEEKKVNIPDREHPLDDYTIKELDQYQKNWEIIT